MTLSIANADASRHPKKSATRTAPVTLKLTAPELVEVKRCARSSGLSRSEWIRNAILHQLQTSSDVDPVLTEICGVQLLLMNVLKPLAEGTPINAVAFDQIVQQVHHAKRDIALRITREGV